MGRHEFDPEKDQTGQNSDERRFSHPYNKIVDEEKALQIIQGWHTKGLHTVVVDAVLDIPHYRHPDYFLACANYGDKLIVRLATDGLVREKKNPEGPIIEWMERARHAAHYPYIDLIVPKKQNGWEWVAYFRPDTIVNSITSPIFIIKQLEENISRLIELGVNLIALDEFAKQIDFGNLYEQCTIYNENKFDKSKFSGTIIKEKIVERARIKNEQAKQISS
jgi:glycerol-3-phosphate cytidylyltransferase-like family protein